MKKIFKKKAALLPILGVIVVGGVAVAMIAAAQTTAMSFSSMGLTYDSTSQTVTTAGTLNAGTEQYQTTAVCNGTTPTTLTVPAPIEPAIATWTVTNSSGVTVANGTAGSGQFYNLAGGATMTFGYVCQGTSHQQPIVAVGSYNLAGSALSVSSWAPGTYTVTLSITGTCDASGGSCATPTPVTWSGTFTIPTPPPPTNIGTISVTSVDSQATTISVPATWSFLSYPAPQDNPCSGHGGSCNNQTQSTYTSLDLGDYILCNQLTTGSCQPTQANLYTFNSVRQVQIASRQNNPITLISNFAKNIVAPAAMAVSTCGQLGPNPPSSCSPSTQTPSVTPDGAEPQASYIILWDPIAAMGVSPTSWNPSVTAGSGAITTMGTITNTGAPGSTLGWSASSNESWLSVSPASGSIKNGASGNASQNITLTADPTGLSAGSYTGTVSFIGNSSPGVAGAINGSITVTLSVTSAPTPAPTVTLSANPTTITSGQSSTLTWSSTNATACSPSWGGSTANGGTATVNPTVTTTYSVTCTGAGGTSQPAAATVTVQSPPPVQPAVTLTASPTAVTLGQSTTLTWTSVGATSCTASGGWSGSEATNGSATETPISAGSVSYTLVCTGAGGTSNPAVAQVTVNNPPPPSQPGYDCVSYACSAVSSSAVYSTLSSCQISCVPPPPPVTSVSVSCNPSSINTSQTSDCTATVSGGSGGGVTWSIVSGPGSINSSTGVYTPPSSVSGSTPVEVQATSNDDPTKSSTATITVAPSGSPVTTVTVSCTPNSVSANQTSTCTATVTGGSGEGVTWTVSGPGTINNSTGVYTAPSTVSATTTVTVTATSIQTPSQSGQTSITVVPGGGGGGGSGEYSCVDDACTEVVSGAQYTSASSCQAACGSGGGGGGGSGYACISNACAQVSSGAEYTSASSCQAACGPGSGSSSGFSCISNACAQVSSGAQYTSASSCQAACGSSSGSGSGYSCVNNACAVVSSGAQYTSASSCEAACGSGGGGGSGSGFSCISNACAVVSSGAQYTSASSCEAACGLPAPITLSASCTPNSAYASQTSTCTATVTGGSGEGVTWTVSGPGTINNSTGVYTAPSTVSATTTVTVTATSNEDPTKTAQATITLLPVPACTPGVNCPVCSPILTASPASIVIPESSNLSYSCENVTECQITQNGTVISSTSLSSPGNIDTTANPFVVTPTSTTMYTLACVNGNYANNANNPVSSSVTVTVGGSSLCEQNPNGAGCPGAQ